MRLAAEDECTAGSQFFGLDMIETALREIGVVPPGPDAQPHD